MTVSLDALIEGSDLDGLVMATDRRCDDGDWDRVVELGDRCRHALTRGLQLWPIVSYVEYRLALSGPASLAAAVLAPGAGRFALGPLAEVAAAVHTWASVAPNVSGEAGPLAAVFAHERVLRGEDLSDVVGIDRSVFEVPLRLEAWEPSYPLAVYHPHRAEFPMPKLPSPVEVVAPPAYAAVEPAGGGWVDEGVRALLELGAVWTTESDGRAEAVAVAGPAPAALGRLGVQRARLVELSCAEALALMAWTAASGGAHGRRRGMAAGRFGAWWAVTALGGALDEWPTPAAVVAEVAASLRWWRWDAGEPETGWACRLVVESPEAGVAWALAATDAA